MKYGLEKIINVLYPLKGKVKQSYFRIKASTPQYLFLKLSISHIFVFYIYRERGGEGLIVSFVASCFI